MGIWIVSQLAVFWFELFRIVPIAHAILFVFISIVLFTDDRTVKPQIGLICIYLSVYMIMGVACGWSPSPDQSFEVFSNTLAASLPSFFAAEYLSRRYNLRSIFIGIHLIPLFIVPQFLYNFYTFGDWAIFDIFSMRTVAGTILAVSTPIIFGYAFYKKSRLSVCLTVLCLILAVLIESRTGVIAVILGILIVYHVFSFRNAFFLSMILTPFVLIFAVSSQAGYLDRFSGEGTNFEVSSDVLSELSVDRSLTVDLDRRLHTFVATEMFLDNPVFGGGYHAIYLNNKFEFDFELPAHGFIGTFAELGMIAILPFGIFLWRMTKLYRRYLMRGTQHLQANALDYILIVSFIMSIFTGFFHQAFESPVFSTVSGLVVGRLGQLRYRQQILVRQSRAVAPPVVHFRKNYI